MRIFSKLPALVLLRRQCSAYCFVTRASLQTAANLLPTSDWRQEAGAPAAKIMSSAYRRNSIATANPGQYLLSVLRR